MTYSMLPESNVGMNRKDFLFLSLQSELWGRPLLNLKELPTKNYSSLMDMANMQTVSGLVCNSLVTNQIKLVKEDAIATFVHLQNLEKKNKELDEGVAKFARLMAEHQIQYFVVKGQTVASNYRHPFVRVPGDIDVYIRKSDLDKALELISRSLHIDIPVFKGKHVSFDYCDTELEVHSKLQHFNSAKHQAYWDRIFDGAFETPATQVIGGEEVKVLEPTLMVLHIFVHLYFHLLVLGVGLRQVVDLAVCLHSFKESVDWKQLETHLRALGLYDAFCAIGYVIIHKLGLPQEEFGFGIRNWHKRYEKCILDDMFYRGNFGKYNRRVRTANRWHTLETGWIVLGHALKFFRLSPAEVSRQLPRMMRGVFRDRN